MDSAEPTLKIRVRRMNVTVFSRVLGLEIAHCRTQVVVDILEDNLVMMQGIL